MQGNIHPDISCLRRVRSLSRFDDRQLGQLAANLRLETAAPGECLIDLGSCEKSSLFLVEGSLLAVTRDRQQTRYTAAAGELSPIDGVRPSRCRVVAAGEARYFRLHPERLADFARAAIDDAPADVDTSIEIDPAAGQSMFQIRLFEDLLNDELRLPSLPDVAQRIQQAFADNLVTPHTVGAIIQSDPVITAKMIMVANSALYGGRVQIESLQQAVVRLGLETTRQLVMTFAVSELFDSETSQMRAQMRAVWKHSQHVASLCRLLAERLDGFDVEQAQLAGLVHDIGAVAILQYAQHHETLRDDARKLQQAVDSLRPQVTGMLLEQWNFGREFVTVGEQCEDWFRNPGDQPELCDLVLIAQYHALLGTPRQGDLPPIAALPAFAKLGMGNLRIEQVIEFMQKSRDKIRSIEATLGSI